MCFTLSASNYSYYANHIYENLADEHKTKKKCL